MARVVEAGCRTRHGAGRPAGSDRRALRGALSAGRSGVSGVTEQESSSATWSARPWTAWTSSERSPQPCWRLRELSAALPLPHCRQVMSRPPGTRYAAPWSHKVLGDLFDRPPNAGRRAGSRHARPTWGGARRAGAELATMFGPESRGRRRPPGSRPAGRSWTATSPSRTHGGSGPPSVSCTSRRSWSPSCCCGASWTGASTSLPDGASELVDYKSGSSRRRCSGQGAVPDALLRPGDLALARGPAGDAAAGLPRQRRGAAPRCPTGRPPWRPRRKVVAIWDAIKRAEESGDWRPSRGRLCDWCPPGPLPAWGGTPHPCRSTPRHRRFRSPSPPRTAPPL